MPQTVFLFSGQGSHYYQMGRDLFEQRGAFYCNALELDDLIRQHLGVSIVAAIYDPLRNIGDLFNQTILTHSAIFLVEHALGRALLSEGVEPDFMMATSMGAFAALALAGCITVEQAVQAVVRQAQLLDAHCEAGGMLALPNIGASQVAALAARFDCEVGSVNTWTSNTIAADQAHLDVAESALRRDGIAFQRLAVSRAFHSRWIDAAEAPYRACLASIRFKQPKTPVVCCVEVKVLHEIPAAYFWNVIRRPIRFDDAIQVLCGEERLRFIDVGPSGTLATSLKYCAPHLRIPCDIQTVLSPFGGGALRYHQVVSASRSA